MARLARVNAVLFDFGGTLDADGVAWKERFYAGYRDEGLAMDEAAFARHFYAADDPLVGGLPDNAGLEETAERLTANLEAGFEAEFDGGDPARGRRVAARFVADACCALTRSADALAGLAGRYKLGIVSNFYGNLAAICRESGIAGHLGAMIDSHQVGVEKPAPEIFHAALRDIDAKPEETTYVGDSLRRDRIGAQQAGLGFVWVAPRAARAAAGPVDHPVIANVSEVAEVLR